MSTQLWLIIETIYRALQIILFAIIRQSIIDIGTKFKLLKASRAKNDVLNTPPNI